MIKKSYFGKKSLILSEKLSRFDDFIIFKGIEFREFDQKREKRESFCPWMFLPLKYDFF